MKKQNKVEGLGDIVALITSITRLDRLTKWLFGLFGKDCGCERRREKWNKAVPIKRKHKL